MLRKIIALIVLGSLALAILCGCQLEEPQGAIPDYLTEAIVTKVTDGDTIQVVLEDGSEAKVRLIGVNTPETRHPTKGKEPFGPEASAYTKDALTNKRVYLEKDVSDTDRYQRLLRYVWTDIPENRDDETEIRAKLFNARLIIDGYGQAYTYPPDVARAEFFLRLQREAREEKRGLWSMEAYQTDATTSASQVKNVPHPEEEDSYVGNASSKKFHRPSCDSVDRIKPENVILFSQREDAVEAGFAPCKACNP